MNRNDYIKYCVAVENFLTVNKVKPGCHSNKNQDSEPFFSWGMCACCKSHKGGNREDYLFATEGGDTIDATICTDCVYFLAYGKLDDTTMAEIEDSD